MISPFLKKLYDRHREKESFRQVFGFDKPKTREEFLAAECLAPQLIEFLQQQEEEMKRLVPELDKNSPLYAEAKKELERRTERYETAFDLWDKAQRAENAGGEENEREEEGPDEDEEEEELTEGGETREEGEEELVYEED